MLYGITSSDVILFSGLGPGSFDRLNLVLMVDYGITLLTDVARPLRAELLVIHWTQIEREVR